MAEEDGFSEDVLRARDEGRPRPRPRIHVVGGTEKDRKPFRMLPARLPNPTKIPPRQWLYGTQAVRGFVTVVVAPGGAGKTTYALGVGMALATGRELFGDHIFEQVNVSIINLEDPADELDRRVAALMSRHQIAPEALEGRMFVNDSENGLIMSEPGPDGFSIHHPDEAALIEEIRANTIGLVICDPYAESHSLEENSNPHMVRAAAAWRRVARATNCAIILIHHVRKGEVTSIDAARGGKALTDSARVGLLLTTMSEADAELFGIDEDERKFYVRIDDAKQNMAAARAARWFRLENVALGNTDVDPRYPEGDNVQSIVRWKPESVWQRTTPTELNVVLDIIAAGPEPGVQFSPTKQGGSGRWVGQVLMKELDVTETQAKHMVGVWLRNGVLVAGKYFDKRRAVSRELSGVTVDATKKPDV